MYKVVFYIHFTVKCIKIILLYQQGKKVNIGFSSEFSLRLHQKFACQTTTHLRGKKFYTLVLVTKLCSWTIGSPAPQSWREKSPSIEDKLLTSWPSAGLQLLQNSSAAFILSENQLLSSARMLVSKLSALADIKMMDFNAFCPISCLLVSVMVRS